MIFDTIPLSTFLWNKNIWGLIIAIVFIIFGILSIVFAYHWKRFGKDLKIIKVLSFFYIIISAGIITLIIMTYNTL